MSVPHGLSEFTKSIALLACLFFAAACSYSSPQIAQPSAAVKVSASAPATNAPTSTESAGAEELGQVIKVIDGDTIDVSIAGQTFRIRYIGVNTPESDEPCYQEATAGNAALVSGQMVRLTKDVSNVDRFGRLLRYVFVEYVFVNSELVRQGYAEAKEYPPDTIHAAYLESLEAEARAANLICYATGVFGGAVTPAPTQMIAPAAPLSGNCDAAYPMVCIPAPPPDLNCSDIPYTNFTALLPDPHHFDGNGDGVACER